MGFKPQYDSGRVSLLNVQSLLGADLIRSDLMMEAARIFVFYFAPGLICS